MGISGDGIELLLVEDDARIATLLTEFLERHGVIVQWVANGRDAFAAAMRRQYSVIVLDLMLPDKNGLDFCRELRAKSDVPIIMVTALGEEPDRVLGLELGADDYMVKPISARELLARIRSVLRRARAPRSRAERRIVGPLTLEPDSLRAKLDGAPLDLTAYEFSLLLALADSAGRVLSREQLLERAKGDVEAAFDRSIDVQISRLRRKLGDDAKKPRFLKTIRGAGYMLCWDGQKEC